MTVNIDDRIKQCLSAEDAKLVEQLASEPSILEMGLETLRGRNRWVTLMVFGAAMVFMFLGIVTLWNFAAAVEIKALLSWALAFVFCLAAVAMMKLWAWLEIEKNSTIRQIKRLELQIALLCKRLDEKKSVSFKPGTHQ